MVKASHGLNRPRLPAPLGTERHVDGARSDGHCSIAHVKRLLAALAGILGIAWLRRRTQEAPHPVEPDPAEELRAKLAASRDPEPEPEAPPADVAARRQDVHDRARAAIDELSNEE